jgi:hypothetical protein
MHTHDAWIWYLLGSIATLAWKWQRYCYESKGQGIPFKKASVTWFEITTVGSKISWGVTIGIVWAIGAVYIQRIGLEWLFGGFFVDIPLTPSILFLIGSMCEMTVPAMAKWIAGKIPNASFDELRQP